MVHLYTTYTNSERVFYEHTDFLMSLGTWNRVVDYLFNWNSFEHYVRSVFPDPENPYRPVLKFFIWILTQAWSRDPDKTWKQR